MAQKKPPIITLLKEQLEHESSSRATANELPERVNYTIELWPPAPKAMEAS